MPKVVRVEHRWKVHKTPAGVAYYEGVYYDCKAWTTELLWERMRSVPVPCGWFHGNRGHIFAFRNVYRLTEYFTPDVLEAIHQQGYVIAVYDVPHEYICYDTEQVQCTFPPEKAKPVVRLEYTGEHIIEQLKAA